MRKVKIFAKVKVIHYLNKIYLKITGKKSRDIYCKFLTARYITLFNDFMYFALYSNVLLYLLRFFFIYAKIVFNSFNCSSLANKCR